jgi:hypothetical protein
MLIRTRPANRVVACAAAVFFALAAASCSFLEKKGEGMAEARIVVGDVSLSRGGESHPVSAGTRIIPHDALTTGAASKIKMEAGHAGIFVDEGAAFRFLPPTDAESCVLAAEKGRYYFSVPAGGRAMQCHFWDMSIRIASGTDASFSIDASGRLAEFFVLVGGAQVRHGGEAKKVSSCQVVVLDAAGISEDEAVTGERGEALKRLRGWVGETVIDKAAERGGCKPDSSMETAEARAEKRAAHRPAPNPAARGDTLTPIAPPPADTIKPIAQTRPAPQSEVFVIEHIIGPKRIYAGEEFTLKCGVSGHAAVTSYVWRFDGAGDLLISKTAEPQITAMLEKTGDYTVVCEVAGEKGALASQTVKIAVVPGLVVVNAGGPYRGMLNKPVKLLGNAKSRKGKIERYEWYLSHNGTPDYALTENVAVSHTFTKSGNQKAVFAVRFADGTAESDTALVSVGSLLPVADAGADVVPKPNGKVKLKGTGSSPDGRVVKYEWDFEGDGVFDWSSGASGEVEHVFKAFSKPVFRVTDTEGNTAADTARVVICPDGMATVENGKYCVDKYEWPNMRGAAPLINVSWHEAAKTCESAGKRLCAIDEWKRACRNGGDYKPADGNSYPYGDDFGDLKCNTLGNPKSKNALMPAGALNECAGALGIYDMSGNAAEWTAPPAESAKAQAFGGFYQSGAEESGCESGITLDKNKKYIYTGFRCCK